MSPLDASTWRRWYLANSDQFRGPGVSEIRHIREEHGHLGGMNRGEAVAQFEDVVYRLLVRHATMPIKIRYASGA